MKTAVSLPDDLFDSAERLAARLGTTRSGLYALALAEFVAKNANDDVTTRLNDVYNELASNLDPSFEEAQSRSISTDRW